MQPVLRTSLRSRALRTVQAPVTSLFLLAVIMGLDAVRSTYDLPFLLNALTDELAHLATAGIAVLAAFSVAQLERRELLMRSALTACVAIDLDHVLLYLDVPNVAACGRPYTHSVATVALLLAGSRAWPRRRTILTGAALGVALHLFRDVGTGPGLPLWWRTGWFDVGVPYVAYLGAVTGLAVTAATRRLIQG